MTSVVTEPLDPETWFNQVERLHGIARAMDGEAPDAAIRRAYHLSRLAPGPLRQIIPSSLDESALEALLECGGYESAVMALFGNQAGITIKKYATSPDVTVSVSLEESGVVGRGKHHTFAKALLEAWAQCLVNIGKAAQTRDFTDRDLRKFLGGSRPNSTEH